MPSSWFVGPVYQPRPSVQTISQVDCIRCGSTSKLKSPNLKPRAGAIWASQGGPLSRAAKFYPKSPLLPLFCVPRKKSGIEGGKCDRFFQKSSLHLSIANICQKWQILVKIPKKICFLSNLTDFEFKICQIWQILKWQILLPKSVKNDRFLSEICKKRKRGTATLFFFATFFLKKSRKKILA